MTTTSRIALVIDTTIAALVSVLPANCPVYDGPMVPDVSKQQWCIVGGDGAEDDETIGGSFTQEWAGFPAPERNEQVDIPCALVAWVGDEAPFKVVRDMVVANLALLEANLLANVGAGVSTGVQWDQLVAGSLHYRNTTAGIVARLPFTIHAFCTI